MPHDFTHLIAELDAAKADLARSVKRCRTFLGERRLPSVTVDTSAEEPGIFTWQRSEEL